VVVVVAFFLFSLCFGGLVLVGVLIKPWADTFGWQRGEISGAYLIATLSLATGGVAFGRLSDRCSLRLLATLGAIAISASLLLLSAISALWQVYVLFALYGALGMGTIYIPLTASITHWFSSNRGIAVAAAMSGAAIGMGIVPLVASGLIETLGWQTALFYIGLGYLAISLPLIGLIRNPPREQLALSSAPKPSAHEKPVWISPRESLFWVCSAIVFCCICMAVPQVHIPALASDFGFAAERAASVLTVVMVAGAIGRLAFGRIADKVGPLKCYMLASFGQTAFVFWFTQSGSVGFLYSLAVVFGLFFGGVSMSALLTIRSLVPARVAGGAIGLVSMFGWIGMGLGGFLGGYLFDWAGSYRASFAVAAGAGVINLCILTLLYLRLRSKTRMHLDFEPAAQA
jgi:MFS family permease